MRGEGYYERTVSERREGAAIYRRCAAGISIAKAPRSRTTPGVQYLCDAEAAEARDARELSRMPASRRRDRKDRRAVAVARSARRTSGLVLEDQGTRSRGRSSTGADSLAGRRGSSRAVSLTIRRVARGASVGYMTQMTADESDRLGAQGYDPSELSLLRSRVGVGKLSARQKGRRALCRRCTRPAARGQTGRDVDPRRGA